jgi:phytoene synthase
MTPEGRDFEACEAAIRHGSRSFFAASLLLPGRVRRPALSLYAFCRMADDAVDLHGDEAAAVSRLRERLARVYAGRPENAPADRAFTRVVERFAMPRALPEALIEGFEWDAQGRRYADFAALAGYAARVAGSVGAMMAVLMGARTAPMLARACDLGVAMQLTNIARDVGEDARDGRLYLPLAWLARAGLEPDAFLAHPSPSPELARITGRLLEEADRLYLRAEPGLAALPAGCRPAMYSARFIYAGIGGEVARAGHDSVTRRARTGGARKAALTARALMRSLRLAGPVQAGLAAPPLPATAFLVEAASRAPGPARPQAGGLTGLIDLMAELEGRDRAAARRHGLGA